MQKIKASSNYKTLRIKFKKKKENLSTCKCKHLCMFFVGVVVINLQIIQDT